MYQHGDRVGDYVIDAFVGAGSSADVYRVRRARAPGEAVPTSPDYRALKILHPEAARHARARERFAREFEIASMLHHPNIVAVDTRCETSVADDRTAAGPLLTELWMTMQYIDGTQSGILTPHGSTEPDLETIGTASLHIADALDYAHRNDVLHRDVKPTNILLSAPRSAGTGHIGVHAYLNDFGIAQLLDDTRPLARNGRVQGSIAYAAPELLQAQQLSPATDLYALACSMFEWLTGHPPYPRATPFAITYAHLRDPIPRLTRTRGWLPSALDSIFAKALAKDADERYATCTEFASLVVRVLRDVAAPAPAAPRSRWFWPHR